MLNEWSRFGNQSMRSAPPRPSGPPRSSGSRSDIRKLQSSSRKERSAPAASPKARIEPSTRSPESERPPTLR
jgi:hypothetical protein